MARDNHKPVDSAYVVSNVSDDTLVNLTGYNIKRASNVFQSDLALTLKPLELRMITFTALVLIIDNPGLRQSQLADALAIERPNCVAVIDELERRKIIIREQVPTDRRAYALMPTVTGKRLYTKAVAAVKAHENALLDQFSNDERATINAANRLINTIRKRGLKK